MKKLVFMALAAVFMVSSGFSVRSDKNLNVVPEYDCTYTIVRTSTNIFGQTYREFRTFSVQTVGPLDCEGHIGLHLAGLNAGAASW